MGTPTEARTAPRLAASTSEVSDKPTCDVQVGETIEKQSKKGNIKHSGSETPLRLPLVLFVGHH